MAAAIIATSMPGNAFAESLGGGTKVLTEADLTDDKADVSIPIEYTVGATFSVRLPSSITLGNNAGSWGYSGTVGVKGDIDAGSEVLVTPDASVTMYDVTNRPTDDIPASADEQAYTHKDAKNVAVTQTKTAWKQTEINPDTYTDTDLNLNAGSMQSGKWKGNLNVNIQSGRHEYVEDMSKHVDATCTSAGSRTVKCSICGEETTETIPATGHSYEENVTVEASCTQLGEVTNECSECGDGSTVSTYYAHNYVDHYCTDCGAHEPGVYDSDGNLIQAWTDMVYIYDEGSQTSLGADMYTYEYMLSEYISSNGVTLTGKYDNPSATLVLPSEITQLSEYMDSLEINVDTLEIPGGTKISLQCTPRITCNKLSRPYDVDTDLLASSDSYDARYGAGNWIGYITNPFTASQMVKTGEEYQGMVITAMNDKVLLHVSENAGHDGNNFTVNEGIEIIANEAFRGAPDWIESVTIPSSVKYIGGYAFGEVPNLTEIYYDGTQEQWNAIEKNDSWYGYSTPITTIHCTDGDITL